MAIAIESMTSPFRCSNSILNSWGGRKLDLLMGVQHIESAVQIPGFSIKSLFARNTCQKTGLRNPLFILIDRGTAPIKLLSVSCMQAQA